MRVRRRRESGRNDRRRRDSNRRRDDRPRRSRDDRVEVIVAMTVKVTVAEMIVNRSSAWRKTRHQSEGFSLTLRD